MKTFNEWFVIKENINDFNAQLQKMGITVQQLIRQTTKQPPDGTGGNSYFYKIHNMPAYGLRIRKSGYLAPNSNDYNYDIQGSDDDLEHNFGQAIGKIGPNIEILKVQQGSPAGMPYGINRKDQEQVNSALMKFRQRVQDAAELPQEAYDQLAQQLVYLNQKGYNIDPSKAGNILVDPQKGFNLVDINKRRPESNYRNSIDHIMIMLIDNANAQKLGSDPEVLKWRQEIIKKLTLAGQKYDVPFSGGSSTQYSYDLAQHPYDSRIQQS